MNKQAQTHPEQVTQALPQNEMDVLTERPEEMWRRYEFIANTSSDFMTLINANYRYEAANTAYCTAQNKPRDQIVGKLVAEVWGEERFNESVKPWLDTCFAGNQASYQHWFEFSSLGVRYMDVTYYPYHSEQGDVTHAVVVSRDMTSYKLAEDQTRLQLRRLTALHDMAITSRLDLDIILDLVLDQVTTQLEIDAACILLLNNEHGNLVEVARRGFRNTHAARAPMSRGQGLAGLAAESGNIVRLPGVDQSSIDPTHTDLLKREGFETYYGVPLLAAGDLKGVLELFHRSRLSADAEWLSFLETLGGQAGIAIDNARLFEDVRMANVELVLAYDATLEGWVRTLDMRDEETEGHTQRVTAVTIRLARAMGLEEVDIVNVRRGALLHDIGKMAIPDSILRKPGPLTDEEWVIMRKHPQYAYDLLSPIPFLRPALDIPYSHHEKWDGTGYPQGLMGEEIPLTARLFAVVDVWDALRSDRPYRAAWPEEKVRDYISTGSGTHFDPDVVKIFLSLDLAESFPA